VQKCRKSIRAVRRYQPRRNKPHCQTSETSKVRVLLHDTKLRRAKVPPAIRGCLSYYKLQTSLRDFDRDGVLRVRRASQITNLDNFGKNRYMYGLVQPYRLRHNFRLAQQSRPGVLSWSLCIATPVNCYHLCGLHDISIQPGQPQRCLRNKMREVLLTDDGSTSYKCCRALGHLRPKAARRLRNLPDPVTVWDLGTLSRRVANRSSLLSSCSD
jgi:hypothetical protein